MKKIILPLALVSAMIVSGCGKIQDQIDDLNGRLEVLEGSTVKSITEQISGINSSIEDLEGVDAALQTLIDGLTSNLKPEMSAYEVKDALVEAIGTQKFDFIVVNYANGDMVGHTGVYEAIEKAVVAVDACVNATVEAAKANGYEVIIIADHGNADNAVNSDDTPNTAHSLNPVPCVYVTENKEAKITDGILADVAPTILHIMGMEQPAEMSGKNLIG